VEWRIEWRRVVKSVWDIVSESVVRECLS
jgi:hypothetical protein